MLIPLLCSALVSTKCEGASATIEASQKVVEALQPILELVLSTRQQDSEATEFQVGCRLQKLLDDQSRTEDEVLVVLLSCYIGESNGGDVLHSEPRILRVS